MLRTSDNKIVVPLHNRSRIIELYHDELCHPGTNGVDWLAAFHGQTTYL